MSEVLVDYTQFNPIELAGQLHETVQANENLLRQRNLLGVIARYGSTIDLAEDRVRKGQANNEEGVQEHYAIVNEAGNVVGAASAMPELALRRLHLPIPPALAVPPLTETFKFAKPNIAAWTDINEEERLVGAYRQLAQISDTHRFSDTPHEAPWTIEPVRSPRHIKVALKMAGLTRVATRLFDDGESRIKVPPISSLYIKTETEYVTAHGRQKEVRKGQWKSGWDEFWDEVDDYGSRQFAGK